MLIKLIDLKKIITEAFEVHKDLEKPNEEKVWNFMKKETHRYLEFYAHMTRRNTEYDLPAVLAGVFRYHKTSMKNERETRELLTQVDDITLKKMSDKAVMAYLKQYNLIGNLQGQGQ